jgi:signal transduction histidine kinase
MGRLITKAGKRMFRLIEDLLDLNKLEQGELSPELQRFDLLPLVQDVCVEYQEKAQAKAQSLKAASGRGRALGLLLIPCGCGRCWKTSCRMR